MSNRVTTKTWYEGSAVCKGCDNLLTPVEVMWSRDGYCETCHSRRMDNLLKSRMASPEGR